MTNQEWKQLKELKEQALKELWTGEYSIDEYRATMASLLFAVLEYDKAILDTLQELRNFEMS